MNACNYAELTAPFLILYSPLSFGGRSKGTNQTV